MKLITITKKYQIVKLVHSIPKQNGL